MNKGRSTKLRVASNDDDMLIHEHIDLWARAYKTLSCAYHCIQGIRNWVVMFRNDHTLKT